MIRSLHSAASGMEAQQLNIDVIANNLANVNTTGFKRSRAAFEDLYYQEIRAATRPDNDFAGGKPAPLEVGQGTRPTATQKLFTAGDLMRTDNALDVAVEGEGFFRLQLPDGTYGYTRAGAFQTDAEGLVVGLDGLPLDPPLVVPKDTLQISIERDGLVKAQLPGETDAVEIGRIELSSFVNPTGLKSTGRTMYKATEASGEPIDGFPDDEGFGRVTQGMLEAANVEVVEEMIELIAAQRAYEINSRVIRASDEMLQQAAALR